MSYLNVYNNGELTDYSIIEIIKKYKKFQFLDIGYAGDIITKSFFEITRACNGFKHLGISGYRNIADSIVHDTGHWI